MKDKLSTWSKGKKDSENFIHILGWLILIIACIAWGCEIFA